MRDVDRMYGIDLLQVKNGIRTYGKRSIVGSME